MSNSFPFSTFLYFSYFHNKDVWYYNENYLYQKYKSMDMQMAKFCLDILKEEQIWITYNIDINYCYDTDDYKKLVLVQE